MNLYESAKRVVDEARDTLAAGEGNEALRDLAAAVDDYNYAPLWAQVKDLNKADLDLSTRIEILHVRDPDSPCDLFVWADGELVEATVASVDPGAGYDAVDWDESTEAWAQDTELSEEFREAVLEARAQARGSEYIEKGRP